MSEVSANKCNRCGKTVIKDTDCTSTGMVQTTGYFIYLCDLKKKEVAMPVLQLGEDLQLFHFCPDCLLETVKEWVTKIKKRGFSV
jgi:hypothetical protein